MPFAPSFDGFFANEHLKDVSDFIIVDDPGMTCDPIMSSSECEAAAQYLGLSDTSASTRGNPQNDPPYCYIEDGRLQFNDGTNTGECGGGRGRYHDECICKGSGEEHNFWIIFLAMDHICHQFFRTFFMRQK